MDDEPGLKQPSSLDEKFIDSEESKRNTEEMKTRGKKIDVRKQLSLKRIVPVTKEEIDSLANNTVTQNTRKQTKWAVNLFQGM